MTETINTFRSWIQNQAQASDVDFALSPELRTAQLTAFEATAFPSRKDEEWRYTPLKAVLNRNFTPNASVPIGAAQIDELKQVMHDALHLIFVNGIFSQEYSSQLDSDLPAGLVIKELSKLENDDRLQAEGIITQAKFTDDNTFQHVALGLSTSGLFISLEKDIDVETPIHILHLNSGAPGVTFSNPVTVIHLGNNSHLRMVQQFVSTEQAETITLPVETIRLEQGAKLDSYKIGLEYEGTDHISNSAIHVGPSAKFNSHQYLLGSRLTRSNLEVNFGGPGANAVLRGIYLGRNEQHLDIRTYVDHAYPNCESDQHFRGIMDDHSRGVFNGMVLVRKDAQQTDAQQSNKNLLLSRDARIDTKPQLEIFADDVKCTHGATIGELDSEALFYLQSRGISKEDAILMLTRAFAAEITDEIEFEALKEHIQLAISKRLTGVAPNNA